MLAGGSTEAGKPAKAAAANPTSSAATAGKPPAGKAAPAAANNPSEPTGCLMQQLEQELATCSDTIHKACTMYYSPAVPEGKPAAGQGKTKNAAPPEAATSLVPSNEGPGAITRPTLILSNLSDMEVKCSGRIEGMRSEAQTRIQQASDQLRKQVRTMCLVILAVGITAAPYKLSTPF